jgi:proline racemase
MTQVMYKIIQAKDFIKAKPSGEVDLEQSKKILGEMAEMASLPGEYNILLDVRETFGNMDHDDVWELVEELGQRRKAFKNKIAVLTRNDEQFNKAAFAEMCANMSMHDFTLSAFTEFEQATEWLQSSGGLDDLLK